MATTQIALVKVSFVRLAQEMREILSSPAQVVWVSKSLRSTVGRSVARTRREI